MRLSNEDRARAEAAVMAGVRSGNWQASGMALIVDALAEQLAEIHDALLDIRDQSTLDGAE